MRIGELMERVPKKQGFASTIRDSAVANAPTKTKVIREAGHHPMDILHSKAPAAGQDPERIPAGPWMKCTKHRPARAVRVTSHCGITLWKRTMDQADAGSCRSHAKLVPRRGRIFNCQRSAVDQKSGELDEAELRSLRPASLLWEHSFPLEAAETTPEIFGRFL